MPISTRGQALREAIDRRASLLHTVAALVSAYLLLSIRAISLPALSKAWKHLAREQRAKERALEDARSYGYDNKIWTGSSHASILIYVPLWAAQSSQPPLSNEQQRRFRLRPAARADVGAVDWFGVGDDDFHHTTLSVSAARHGHLQALQWLRDRGCTWAPSTCSAAARGGHLAVLQWARANGCDWDAFTCTCAVHGGHLAVLQWARANGCAWDTSTGWTVKHYGGQAVLEWARANGCPGIE